MSMLLLKASSGRHLTKTFTRHADGTVSSRSFEDVATFDATEAPVQDIFELSNLLTTIETIPTFCIVRGELIDGFEAHSIRRTLYDTDKGPATMRERAQGNPWVLIDFDKIPAPEWLPADLRHQYLFDLLPEFFHNVSYHFRWSASAGLNGWETLSCHFWFWLTEPWRSDDIRKRIKIEGWEGVDTAPFSANQIHYTALPKFVGMDDPIAGSRSGLVKRQRDAVHLPDFEIPYQAPEPLRPKKDFTGTGWMEKFEEMLDEIGPNYHIPIRDASLFYVMAAQEPDLDYLKSRLEDAIASGTPGKSDKNTYDSRYLDRMIGGAIKKFL